ncbi:MAG: DUF1501 domain-containing protein [Halothece sp. Uz-M2-17]|nr:DUF1501 domain-containing protein [Halothece sp. Uz-M2-17]
MKRRQFLRYASLFGASTLVPIGTQGWLARSFAENTSRKNLVVILLRGGMDGLNVVVPYNDPNYYEARPLIAIPATGEGRVLDLDGVFGLHPALVDLMPLWKNQTLGFVHNCGYRNNTRSHFAAQDYLENGTPGVKSTTDGWLNRLLKELPEGGVTQALSFTRTTPHILAGLNSVVNQPLGKGSNRRLPVDRPVIASAFDQLYQGTDALSTAYSEGIEAREIVLQELQAEMKESAQGAPSPKGFKADAGKIARLIRGKAQTQIAFLSFGGWDTHVNQGSSQGQLAKHLKNLGEGLATLVQELGSDYQNTMILVMSEFGRTVAENGNGGTDHGQGNVVWVLGGNLKGGQVDGKWRGLDSSQLYQGRDLAVTTDFRDAIAPILTSHLQLHPSQLARVFPDYQFQKELALFKSTS